MKPTDRDLGSEVGKARTHHEEAGLADPICGCADRHVVCVPGSFARSQRSSPIRTMPARAVLPASDLRPCNSGQTVNGLALLIFEPPDSPTAIATNRTGTIHVSWVSALSNAVESISECSAMPGSSEPVRS